MCTYFIHIILIQSESRDKLKRREKRYSKQTATAITNNDKQKKAAEGEMIVRKVSEHDSVCCVCVSHFCLADGVRTFKLRFATWLHQHSFAGY